MAIKEEDLYNRIVSKYPAYANIPQAELMPKIYAKFPQYQQQIEQPKVAGIYDKKDLATKMIPQFTKGLYESVPFGRQVVAALPNADLIKQVQEGTPAPEGALPFIARLGGEIAGSTPLMNIGGGFTKLPNLARLAIGGAAYSGAKSFGEGNKPLDIAKDAAMGAGATVAGYGVAKGAGKGIIKGVELASKGLGKAPGAVINSLIKPLLKDFSYGKNPGRAVASEGIVANNLDELATKIGQRRQEIGKEIRVKLIQNSKQRVDYRQVLKPLDDAINEASKSPRSNEGLIKRLNDLKLDLLQAKVDPNTGQIIGKRNLIDLTPEEAFEFKSQVGELTKFTGNPSDDQLVNKAMKKIYGIAKEGLNKAVPGLRTRNERYANLMSAEIATKYRDKIQSRQNIIPLAEKITGLGAAVASLASGDPTVFIKGLMAIGLERAITSPSVKTRLAAGLAKLADQDLAVVLTKYPQLKKIPSVAARISVPMSETVRQSNQ